MRQTPNGPGARQDAAANKRARAKFQVEFNKAIQHKAAIEADDSLTEKEKERRVQDIESRIGNWRSKIHGI